MKKRLLLLFTLTITSIVSSWSQCAFACYNYSQTSTTFSQFPSGGTNVISQFVPSVDDGLTGLIPIGFNFNYYCGTYSNVLICSNGFIQFDIGSPPNLSFSNPAQNFPDVASPNGIVAFNMSDFDPNQGGSITYQTVGTSPNQRFIVTYSNVPMWSCSTIVNNGQIILFEGSNLIEIHTEKVLDPNNPTFLPCYPGTQGIESPSGLQGITVSGRSVSNWTANTSSAVRFVPIATYSPVPPTSTIAGSVTLCQGQQTTYSITADPTAQSYNWVLPGGWTGTSTLSTITTTVGISGNVTVSTTYSCGTASPVTLSVTVIPSPIVSITSVTPVIFCSGKTVTIMTSGASLYTLNPGVQIGNPPFYDTPMANVVYTVVGTNTAGCRSTNLATYSITVKQTPTVTVNSGSVCIGATFTLIPTGATSYSYSSFFSQVTPSVGGINTYSITGTSNGCLGAVAVSSVTAWIPATVSVVATRSAICVKESTSLTASGAVSYVWETTLTAATVPVKPNVTTIYSVIGTDLHGCVDTATVSVKVSPCTGIEEITGKQTVLSIYPNPSSGQFILHLEQASSIVIRDLLGRTIFSQKLQEGDHPIDVSSQPAGTFIISATYPEGNKQLIYVKE